MSPTSDTTTSSVLTIHEGKHGISVLLCLSINQLGKVTISFSVDWLPVDSRGEVDWLLETLRRGIVDLISETISEGSFCSRSEEGGQQLNAWRLLIKYHISPDDNLLFDMIK